MYLEIIFRQMAQQCQNPDTYQVKIVKYSDNLRRMILQINPHNIACSYKETFEKHSVSTLLDTEKEFDLFENDGYKSFSGIMRMDENLFGATKNESAESSKSVSPSNYEDTKLCAEKPCAEGISCGKEANFLNKILKNRAACRHHDNCQHGVTGWPVDDVTPRETAQSHWVDDIIRELSASYRDEEADLPRINRRELALKMTASDAEVYKLLKEFRDRKTERRPSAPNLTSFYKSIALRMSSPYCEAVGRYFQSYFNFKPYLSVHLHF